jgi:uncharacterized protein (DUF302 family)
METTAYGLRVTLPVDYSEAVDRATAALTQEGFGVLTTIDVKETLKQKIGQEFRRYVILGACNPVLAHRALQAELEIGLLLPCNVVVYELEAGKSVVAARAPLATLGMLGAGTELDAVAIDADQRLSRALASLEAGSAGAR